jgi:hypothetical protein
MTKAADALAAAGHDVRVISTRHTPWAVEADEAMRRSRSWRWRVIDYRNDAGGWARVRSGLRRRAACALASAVGPSRVPWRVGVAAYTRVHRELVAAALEEPADLFYGGTTGALAATAEAGRRTGTPYGLDLEDFHAEEQEGPDAALMNALGARILERTLPGARFLTTSSSPMACAYEQRFGRRPVTVNNTFPLPPEPPVISRGPGAPLKAYWFSQTIGAGRGLESFLKGAALAGVPIELQLRGHAAGGYVDSLRRLAGGASAQTSIVVSSPAAPDEMVALCRDHDFGLATEGGSVLNRQLSLTNKALTYILAGLAVVLTDTDGQRPLADDLGQGALVYREDDVETLASGLRKWYANPDLLLAARRTAWCAAVRRWHWEHPAQRGALVAAVESGLS